VRPIETNDTIEDTVEALYYLLKAILLLANREDVAGKLDVQLYGKRGHLRHLSRHNGHAV
jgi:hypothetical protein